MNDDKAYNIIQGLLVTQHTELNIICCYFLPTTHNQQLDTDRISSLIKCLSSFLLKTVLNIIVGDFYLRDINLINIDVLGENQNHIFARFTLEHGLQQLVNEPNRENSILDFLLHDYASTVSKVHNLPNFSISDHSVICFNFNCIRSCSIYYKKKLRVPDYKRAE